MKKVTALAKYRNDFTRVAGAAKHGAPFIRDSPRNHDAFKASVEQVLDLEMRSGDVVILDAFLPTERRNYVRAAGLAAPNICTPNGFYGADLLKALIPSLAFSILTHVHVRSCSAHAH
ncbi:MAG: hypothetical protein F4X56_02210 [Gammaproteobacteria bacterium]|nr:hypothetical protein [Gammaproteobacteria bacterium]